jgi:hypothetical protein
MLTDLGVRPSDKKVRNALKKVGDLSTQENIDAFKDILTDEANGKGNLSEARQQAAQLALERLDVIESKLRQQSEVMNESTNRPSPNTQTSGNTSDAVGSRTEPSVPLPTQRAPTTTQETQVTESGGVGVPSGDANTNNAVSGVREGSRQDTLAAQEEWASLSDVPFESLTPADQSRVVKAYEKGQSHEDDVSPMQAVAAQIRRRNSQLSKESKDESKEDVPPVEPSTTEEVNQAMGELLTPNQIARKPPIVVNDLSGLEGILPSDVIADVKAGGAKAFVHKGQDYYIASHIPKGNAKGTILHEKGGHLGLTKLIGASRIKALANRVNTWATSATSPMFGKEKAEITIAKEAIARANASGEPVGSDRYNQEVVAYFTEIAVNKYGIDPLETQPKEFDKVVGWLRDLWAGITDSLHKLRYAPETLKAKDIVDLVMGAARVEAMPDTKTTPTAEKTTADAPAQFSFEKQIPPSPADKAIAAQNGIRLPKRLTQEGVIAKLKARFNEITDNDLWGYLAQKNVGAGEAHALKHGTMYGTGERLNPLTGKEVGFVNLHRTLQADNIAMEAVNRGFPQLDKEGVAHVIPAASNMRALAGISTQIRADMKADGMSDALADTSIDYMLIADRHKELEAMGIDTGITNAEYLYGKKMQAKYAAQFRAWRDMHQKIREKTMQFLVDTNLFTPKKAREFLDRMEYVPFNREIPPGESTGAHLRGLLSAKKEHHIKGAGGLEIKDVMENIINNQVFLIKRGMANNTANLVADDMMRMNKDDNTQGGFEIPRDDKQGNNVEYLKQGQSQWFKVLNRNDAAIFHAAPVVNNIAVRIARTATGMLRKGITLMPTFTYNQLLQDPQRASFTAGTTSGVLGLAKTSLPEFRKNAFGGESPLAREGRAAGIVGAIDYQDTYDNWNKEVRGATRTGISKWFEKAERIARAQDLSNRLAVYKDVMDHGGTQNDATARAIMMYNYQNRGQGQHVSVLMALAPFINCRVQGDYRVLMALQGRLPGVTKAEAKKLVAKKILTFAAYTMMYTMATSGSDDRERADENTANNNFLLGGVKIPATPEFLPLKIAIEKSYRMMAGNINETKGKFAQAVSNAAKNLLVGPSDINPTAIKPLVENAFNHSTLTGKPLVGYTLQQKDVNMQFGDSTSEFSKAISDELQKLGGNTANMSPIKIDNLIKGWFGSVGRDALYTVDMLVGDKPAQKANRLPLVGGIFYDKEGNARVSDLYDLADESNRAWNTLADLEKHHPEKAEAYQKANLPLLRVHDSLKDMTSLLNEMREAKKAAVRENPATARAEISRLDAMANKILEKELPAIRKELGK